MDLDISHKQIATGIILVTLALCALFLAQGTTRLMASSLLPLSPPEDEARTVQPAPGTAASTRHTDPKAILKRNIFDHTVGPLWPPPKPEPEQPPEEEQVAPLPEGVMPPPCEDSMRLVASVYSDDYPEWSFASVRVGNEAPFLYRTGNQIKGKEVVSVFPEAVFLRSGSSLCSMTLFSDRSSESPAPDAKTRAPKRKKPSRAAAKRSRRSRSGGVKGQELDKGITKTGDTSYTIQRSLVDKLLMNQAELMRAARIVPHERNGQVVGVKLYGIRRNSLLGKLGLQNGDLLRTINGYDMASPDKALEAYSRLRNADNLSVAIQRRGRNLNMDYQIQ